MKILILLFPILILTACTNPFGQGNSTVDEGHHPGNAPESTPEPTPNPTVTPTPTATPIPTPTPSWSDASQGDVVSSAGLHVQTSRGYKVFHSVETMNEQIFVQTSRGYQFFSTIQGNIISESP